MSFIDKNKFKSVLASKSLLEQEEIILKELEHYISEFLSEKVRVLKNKSRVLKNDSNKDKIPVISNLPREIINELPKWVRDDIENSFLIGTSKKVIQTSSGRKYHISNKLNSLSGNEWTFFLNSVVNTRYPTIGSESYAHHIRKIHPSPKPPQLMKQIIEFFTKENEVVLDYFMGVGGTLIGASLSNRKAIGIDLSSEYVKTYQEANQFLRLKEQKTLVGDSLKILKGNKINELLAGEDISLILIDPPYGDMMSRKKTGEAVKNNTDTSPTPFTNLDTDLGNMGLEKFLLVFQESVKDALKLLKNKGHIVVFVKDLQPKGKELNLLHSDLIHYLNKIPELNYLGTKIWADQGVNLYPYGYPFSYVANQIHQYILIFRKSAL